MVEENNEPDKIIRNIIDLPIDKLKEFEGHPFKTYEGEQLEKLAASIIESGVLIPIIVRQKKLKTIKTVTILSGDYEILSGHNRVKAAKIAGFDKIPAEVRDVDDAEAVVIVNQTNLQQRSFKDWLESQKARSISQYYESIKSQGKIIRKI
jgi:ParB family chromosome partitioning protein